MPRSPMSRRWVGRPRPAGRRLAAAGLCVAAAAAFASLAAGCVEQELHVDTNPDGALVYMNDQEVGRTPIRRPFTYYGTYDVVVRKEGYQTLRVKSPVIAPAWLWVPFDLVLTVLPIRFTDTQRLKFELKPEDETSVDPDLLLRRADGLRGQLESGTLTQPPRTPTSAPATRPATKRSPAATKPKTTAPAATSGPTTNVGP